MKHLVRVVWTGLLVALLISLWPARAEPLGPSSRRSGLVISEIMYHPAPRTDGRNPEFIELYNAQAVAENLGGYRLSGELNYTFPTATSLPAGGFLVVAPAPADVEGVYGITGVLGGTNTRLNNRSGTIRLLNRLGAVLLEVSYASEPPWPVAADGAGHSLVLGRPSLGERDPFAWAASVFRGGSPGAPEPQNSDSLQALVINEFLARAAAPAQEFIELYNHSAQTVDIGGCYLTDEPATAKFEVPSGTQLGPAGLIAYDRNQLGFAPSPAGGSLYLVSPDRRVLDAVRYGGQAKGIATGRFPEGAPELRELVTSTPGTPNAGLLIRDVVINEVMYHPVSGEDNDQYVELFNQGTNAVELGAWRFVAGIDFTFPPDRVLPAGGYLVVARNARRLMTNYANLTPNNTVGDFLGSLSHGGERLALALPEELVSTNVQNQVTTNLSYVVVDEVSYGTGGRWGKWTDGGGSSLELIDPRSDHRRAANWADSDETGKSDWTNIEFTGVCDNGAGYPMNNLQIILLDAGECLIDNVEVIGPGGTNRIANSTFENGLTNWVGQGTHEQISLESLGYQSGKSLHLRATGRGDTGANRLRTPVVPALASGNIATLRAKVQWLRGQPEILLRLHGNYLEAAGRMSVPANLGTPGARNSRAVGQAGPAIYDLTHTPVLPAANQSVVIAARVSAPNGLDQLWLNYRIDPATNYNAVVMLDDGTGGDGVAGDGIYSATIPGKPADTLVAFYIQARAHSGSTATATFPQDPPGHECLVRFGDKVPAGKLGTYRVWMTKATSDKWTRRLKMSNDPLDTTFVYGNDRVVYSVGAMYSGSPFHAPSYSSPTLSPCDYTLLFPADDQFLGETDVHISWTGNTGDDPTGLREQTAYWIASELGLPINYRRFVNLFVNGVKRSFVMEDTQRDNARVVDEWYPQDHAGDLFKVAGWFEFDDGASGFNTVWATLQNFTTTNVTTGQRLKKPARYRWNWQPRAAHNSPHDFDRLFPLVDALNTTPTDAYTTNVNELVDVEQWMRTFAVEHLTGNWDAWGSRQTGQNMYAYKPVNDTWKLMIWDFDIALGGLSDGPTAALFQSLDPTIGRLLKHPPCRRAYYRALRDAVNGPLVSSNANAFLDVRYAALLTNGIAAANPSGIKSYISSRRTYLLAQLAKIAADFAITSNGGSDFDTDHSALTLTGTAPVEAKTIAVNGVEYPVTWTTLTNWTLTLPLVGGLNPLTVQGYGLRGNLLASNVSSVNVNYTGPNAPPSNHVVLNEWMASNTATLSDPADGAHEDWFELYNPTDQPVDLSGFGLSQNLTNTAQFLIPAGTLVPAHGFLLAWADNEVGQNAPNADLHVNFKLNREGELLCLFDARGILVDYAAFGSQTPDVSQGRWPDGAPGPFYFMTEPTPRAPNRIPIATLPKIRILDLQVELGGRIRLSWTAQPGRTYRVQYADDLSHLVWHDVPGDVYALGGAASQSDLNASTLGQRYYRVMLVEPE
jgi:hypothetical protein